MPDLVARLSGLHATFSTRLALQQSLLSLSGRLDMVISQIEMRSSAAPAPLPLPGKKNRKKKKGPKKLETAKYIEGDSSEEDEVVDGMDVELESGDDVGSVEDVELGGSEDEDDSEEENNEDEEDEDEVEEDEDYGDDEDDRSEGGAMANGFIDDEAEEFSGEEDEEESD